MAGDTFSTILEILLVEFDVCDAVVFDDEFVLVSFVDTAAVFVDESVELFSEC